MNESDNETDTTRDKKAPASRSRWALPVTFLVIGILTGVGLAAFVGWKPMPGMMLTVHESKYQDVDQTCEALKAAIEAEGLHCAGIRNISKSMAKHGVHLDRQVRVVEFCKADYAHDMLKDNPEVCTLMPCTFGVYEGDDGKVYISGMNQRLMGKMFGRTIAKVMGERVARDEARILKPNVR